MLKKMFGKCPESNMLVWLCEEPHGWQIVRSDGLFLDALPVGFFWGEFTWNEQVEPFPTLECAQKVYQHYYQSKTNPNWRTEGF